MHNLSLLVYTNLSLFTAVGPLRYAVHIHPHAVWRRTLSV